MNRRIICKVLAAAALLAGCQRTVTTEGGIFDRTGNDVRHPVLVAQDLYRGLQPLRFEMTTIGRQRALHLEIGAGNEDGEGQHKAGQ